MAQLDEAKRLLDAGDAHGALRPLERARGDLLAVRDLDGLQELRREAERGYGHCEAGDEAAYESLLYASAQNIRWLSRKRALERGVPWEDPHPELDKIGRPEIRVERSLPRRAKLWIVAVTLFALAAAAAIGYGVYVDHYHRGWLVNDTKDSILAFPCRGRGTMLLFEPGHKIHYSGWDVCYRFEITPGHVCTIRPRGGTVSLAAEKRRCSS